MRRSTRNFWLFASLFTLCALGLGLWLLWPRESAITEENIARIQPGMHRTEVEAILGGPARNEASVHRGPLGIDYGELRHLRRPAPEEWIGDDWAVTLYFDHGRVAVKRVGQVVPLEDSLLGRLRWLLRL